MSQLPSPLDVLHRALASATHCDLPAVKMYRRDHLARSNLSEAERTECERREKDLGAQGFTAWPGEWVDRALDVSEISIHAMFPQSWGSTALGFGGMGGSAMTDAYTTVLSGPDGDLAVYFNGRFAYLLPRPAKDKPQRPAQRAAFLSDLAARNLADVMHAVVQYGAIPR